MRERASRLTRGPARLCSALSEHVWWCVQSTVRERELELGKREKALAKSQAAADERTAQLAARHVQVHL